MVVCASIVYFLAQVYISSCTPYTCDTSKNVVQQGNNGETSVLSWLGVLRVNLYEGKSVKIALTGIVLVKEGYAIGSADDIAKIPKTFLIEKSKAMFIPDPEKPWYCRVKDYMTHPEYQYTTFNTLALLELQAETLYFPIIPVCWPPYTYKITTDLYAFGFTDENQLLEKSVYKLQHVDLDICKEFYNRAGFSEGMMAPNSFRCGFAANNTRDCLWDNGMALASNTSGHWKLLGFGIKGPGCSAPARFLDMLSFFQWIDTSTDQYDVDDEFRRSALNVGFKKNTTAFILDIPIHDLFTMSEVESRRMWSTPDPLDKYQFDTEQYQDRYYSVERIDKDNVVIWAENVSVPYTHGNCSKNYELVYSEKTKIKTDGLFGKAIYKLSVMDLNQLEFTCIDIKVKPLSSNGKATIYYGVTIDNAEGMSDIEEIPQGLTKTYIKRPTTPTGISIPDEWTPGPQFKVKYIQDNNYVIKQPNINILLRFNCNNEATYTVDIFSARSVPKAPKAKPKEKPKGKKKSKKSRIKPKLNSTLRNKKVYLTRTFINFNETLNSNLEKTFGVDVKEVDRHMKEMTSAGSVRVKKMGDIGVSHAHCLFLIVLCTHFCT